MDQGAEFSEVQGTDTGEPLKGNLGGKMIPSWEILQMISIMTALC